MRCLSVRYLKWPEDGDAFTVVFRVLTDAPPIDLVREPPANSQSYPRRSVLRTGIIRINWLMRLVAGASSTMNRRSASRSRHT